jgi:hypothetical protein
MPRLALLAALPLLAGCSEAALGPAAAVNGVSLMLAQRIVPDLVVSLATGRDCSVAWIDAGGTYCRDDELPPPPPYCTRALGSVDCWPSPLAGLPPARALADGPPAAPPARWPMGRLSIGR